MSELSDIILKDIDKDVVMCLGSWQADGKFQAIISMKPLLEKAIERTELVLAVRNGNILREYFTNDEREFIRLLVKGSPEGFCKEDLGSFIRLKVNMNVKKLVRKIEGLA